jgi:hypothetical protein
MSNDRKRILSHRTRTPGKALSRDDLASVTGGASLTNQSTPVPGCCVQGCTGCDLPGIEPLPLPQFPKPTLPRYP